MRKIDIQTVKELPGLYKKIQAFNKVKASQKSYLSNHYKLIYTHGKEVVVNGVRTYTFLLKPNVGISKHNRLLNIVFTQRTDGQYTSRVVVYNLASKTLKQEKRNLSDVPAYYFRLNEQFMPLSKKASTGQTYRKEITEGLMLVSKTQRHKQTVMGMGGMMDEVTVTAPADEEDDTWPPPMPPPPDVKLKENIGGGGGGGGTSPVTPDDTDDSKKKIIKNELDNSCLQAIFDALSQGDNTIAEFIDNFREHNGIKSVANLILKTDDNFKDLISPEDGEWPMAITSTPHNYNITITFNTDPRLKHRIGAYPPIIAAQSMIHEVFHAEVYRKVLSLVREEEITGLTVEFVNNHRNDFPTIFKYYHNYNINHHEMMAEIELYRAYMAKALADYDNHKESTAFYDAMAWMGLQGTEVWKNLPKEKKDSINKEWKKVYNRTKRCH